MDEEVFASLPESHWTLVVNDLEKYLPELSWIIDQFRFIPEWRFDDLMVSYAADQGSVGPHVDLYDVFILQGQGQRRWQINTQPVQPGNQVDGTPLRIQQDFEAEQEWIVEPGDMLYIPPGVSHHGVSLGDSISYSIGFRAISHADLVNEFIGYITQQLSTQLTYRDPDLKLQQHANEITADALARVSAIFKDYLNPNHPELLRWFGRYSSDTKTDLQLEPEQEIDDLDELVSLLTDAATLCRHTASRFAYSRVDDHALLFVDGEDYEVSMRFAENLCNQRQVDLTILLQGASSAEQSLLVEFYNQGKLYIADDN
jgi:50S ribosomal protein L16 3-hydroxylase